MKKLGVEDLSLLKKDCLGFEKCLQGNYDYEIFPKGNIRCSSMNSLFPRMEQWEGFDPCESKDQLD